MNFILVTLSMETRACFDKFKKLFFFATLCCNLTAFAHLGFEHQSEIVESLFGPKYLEDEAVKELVDYISKGMDFGDVSREATLTKPGSSFLNAVREKFPNFKGSHREFGHWAFDGDIPREVIQNFENVYPGKGDDFKGLWRQFVRTRREATRLGLGLAEDGARNHGC